MARPKKETRATSGRKMASDEYVSQFYINPDFLDTENWHYRWVETHCMGAETQSVERSLREGYEPVKVDDLPELSQHSDMLNSIKGRAGKEQYIKNGDQILMRCSAAHIDAKRSALRKENKNQMSHVDWASQGGAINAPVFVDKGLTSYSRTTEKAFAEDE